MSEIERGGPHEYRYPDGAGTEATPGPTPSQTAGPFFAYGLVPGAYGYAYRDIHPRSVEPEGLTGPPVTVEGSIFDGEGESIHDAMVEIVQADGTGRFAGPGRNDGFVGYARCGTGPDGPASAGGDTRFRFRTVKPAATADGAPSITVAIIMRGLLNHAVTRMYFPEDDHGDDPVLARVPEARRETLVAEAIGAGRYRFDIHMQGPRETVFFDV